MGMESILEGATVILGASTKGEDASRWAGARKYVGDDLELIDPLQSAVEPLVRADGQPFSATDMRNLLGDIAAHKEELRDFAGDNVDGLLRVLGLEALEEVTAMGGGSVEGPAGNFVGKLKMMMKVIPLVAKNERKIKILLLDKKILT